MASAGVPTAAHRTFEDARAAEDFARGHQRLVVKADGLAAGKGVVVAASQAEAVEAIRELSALGAAGSRLVLEEVLEGEELSVIALADGERYVLLPPAQDHKRLLRRPRSQHRGKGAVSPVSLLDASGLSAIGESVIAPVLKEMARLGRPFSGALYAGLMLTPQGPRVLEFNARFGDPEAQVLVLQLEEDLLPLLYACATGGLVQRPLQFAAGASVAVVLASAGYPGPPRTGASILGTDKVAQGTHVFHAATALVEGCLVTSGGRVLSVCAHAPSLAEAQQRAYRAVDEIHFEGMQARRDIGARALRFGAQGR